VTERTDVQSLADSAESAARDTYQLHIDELTKAG
jgi:hypothetical protein